MTLAPLSSPWCSCSLGLMGEETGDVSVKVTSVQAFKEQMKDIFEGNPMKARLVVKYRHADRQLFLRATDDARYVKMRTRRPGDVSGLKRVVGFVVADDDTTEEMMDVEQTGGGPSATSGKRRKRTKKN